MISQRITRFALSASVFFAAVDSARAGQVNYAGRVLGKSVPQALVVVGTFAPNFNVGNYCYAYGDRFGNLEYNAYSHAVADGNFHPIGSGVLTANDGTFAGTGLSDAPVGTPLWMFGFDSHLPEAALQVLASSSAPNWRVPEGSTTLSAAEANRFVLGYSAPGGVLLSYIPIPEPTLMLSSAPIVSLIARRRRR